MANVVEGANVGMRKSGNSLGFALQPLFQGRVGRKVLGQNFNRNVAVEAGIAGAIHFPHTARTELRLNFIRTEFGAGGERHSCAPL